MSQVGLPQIPQSAPGPMPQSAPGPMPQVAPGPMPQVASVVPGPMPQNEDYATSPITGEKIALVGGYKIKQKGGLPLIGNSDDKIIQFYKETSEVLNQINTGGNPTIQGRNYNDLTPQEKTKYLQTFAETIKTFIKLFNKKPDYVKTKMTESAGGKKSKKQHGGADEMNYAKMYNTQGLIVDNNNPIDNALSYNNTADQIPQPFSSGSSGAGSYVSGIDATSLNPVLPILGTMAGGKKKSKRNHK